MMAINPTKREAITLSVVDNHSTDQRLFRFGFDCKDGRLYFTLPVSISDIAPGPDMLSLSKGELLSVLVHELQLALAKEALAA